MATKKSHAIEHSLVIVESPAKAKTINRYLGDQYTVMASMGHVRDLPTNDLGVDLESNFEPVYQILPDRRKIIDGLRKAAAKVGTVFLATDLDREGEAIAWHLTQALDLEEDRTRRVVFNEITKSAIEHAFASPRVLDMDKVNAQQARRLLDRIVGYQLSPLLQMKIGRGLSAGRVQSVAVRLIVEREKEIRAFVPEESWRIHLCFATKSEKAASLIEVWRAFCQSGDAGSEPTSKARNAWLSEHQCLYAELIKVDGKEFTAQNISAARSCAELLGFVVERVEEKPFDAYAAQGLKIGRIFGNWQSSGSPKYAIKDIQKRRTTSKPNAPFTTAALQQAASSYLGFAPSRTMRVAQQLYEGVDLGDKAGPVGLITYMRTDSTNLSQDAIGAVRQWINKSYGANYLPAGPNVFGSSKRAQEAHEAIRPTEVTRTSDSVKGHLSAEQHRLYELIWRRFVACQMVPAQWDSTTILIAAATPKGEALLRTSGRHLVFDGFLKVAGAPDTDEVQLPEVQTGQQVSPLQLHPQQQFSSPPPRYTEASLVKKMEAEGIGRPSTYASIIQTVQDRGYVELVEKKLHPTARGEVVTDKLVEHFPKIMDVKFTSFMEEELDKIEEAHLEWVQVLGEFYEPFKTSLDKARVEMEPAKAEPSDHKCPECGSPMVYRLGKNGRFLSCTAYPECKTSRSIDADGNPVEQITAQEPCKKCGKPMLLRTSRLGPFLGCSGYPDCDQTLPCDEAGVPLKKVDATDIHEKCDDCGSAMVVKFARGKAFMACTAYPKCRGAKPLPPGVYVEKPKPEDAGVACTKCGRPMVIRKSRRGPFISCSGFPRCRNAVPMEKLDELRAHELANGKPTPPADNGSAGRGGSSKKANTRAKTAKKPEELGAPPAGFAWTRTGRPVVETWPEDTLKCPDCGRDLAPKSGRYGPYFGCTGYPKCSFVSNLRGEAKKRAEQEMPSVARPKPIPTDLPCDECGSPMVIRTGRSGKFLGCGKYPKCKFTKPLPSDTDLSELTAAAKS